jgi:hypothetical protein
VKKTTLLAGLSILGLLLVVDLAGPPSGSLESQARGGDSQKPLLESLVNQSLRLGETDLPSERAAACVEVADSLLRNVQDATARGDPHAARRSQYLMQLLKQGVIANLKHVTVNGPDDPQLSRWQHVTQRLDQLTTALHPELQQKLDPDLFGFFQSLEPLGPGGKGFKGKGFKWKPPPPFKGKPGKESFERRFPKGLKDKLPRDKFGPEKKDKKKFEKPRPPFEFGQEPESRPRAQLRFEVPPMADKSREVVGLLLLPQRRHASNSPRAV